jgi:methionyl-tRNA synthetase
VATSTVKGAWTLNAVRETNSWLKKGLRNRCISRDLKWGTPVPKEGFTDKVFYVWFDAPIGYLSITGCYTPEWRQWWFAPDTVELVQFMGKDNVPFHTVIFPSSLIGTEEPYTLLHHVSTTEYLNYEDGKFSKSRGTGVFGDNAQDTGIPSSCWRYYLLSNRPEQSDSDFSWEDFVSKVNSELLNNFGNFINRSLAFTAARFDGKVPVCGALTPADEAFCRVVDEHTQLYITALEAVKIKEGLRLAMLLSGHCNAYLQEQKPWTLLKTEPARCATVTHVCVNVAMHLAILIEPYMPTFAHEIARQLAFPFPRDGLARGAAFRPFRLVGGHAIDAPQPLVQRVDEKRIAELRERFAGGSQVVGDGAAPVVSTSSSSAASASVSVEDLATLTADIKLAGDAVRELKAANAEKSELASAVAALKALKKRQAAATAATAGSAAASADAPTGSVAEKAITRGEAIRAAAASTAYPLKCVVGVVGDAEDAVVPHPQGKGLVVLTINVGGDKPVTTVSPVGGDAYTPAELRGKRVVVLTNVKEQNSRGVIATAQLLLAEKVEGKGKDRVSTVAVVTAPASAAAGAIVVPRSVAVADIVDDDFNLKKGLKKLKVTVNADNTVTSLQGDWCVGGGDGAVVTVDKDVSGSAVRY